MTVYDTFQTAYKLESTWNTDIITNKTTPTYWLGVLAEQTRLPEPVDTLQLITPGPGSREAADILHGQQHFEAVQAVGLMNGHLLYITLGKVSTATSGSDYVHTITPTGNATTDICAERPSVTIHHESQDSGGTLAAKARHYTGGRINSLELSQSAETPILIGAVHWVAGNATTWSNSTLTTDPTDFGSSNLYDWADTTITYDGNSIKQGLQSITINIKQNMQTVHGQRSSESHKPQFLVDAGYIEYKLDLAFAVTGFTLWDDVQAQSGDKDIVVKFQKSSTDYIELTFTNVHPFEPFFDQPAPDKAMLAEVSFQPESLSVSVKDGVSSYT